jgi:nucleoside-diphosphate-sugar epimerase
MIIVTGGTGLVGAHLLFDLCKKHKNIRAIKRQNSDLEQVKKTFAYYSDDAENLFQNIEWLNADVTDYFSLEEAFKGAKQVYHVAAMVSFHEKDSRRMMDINVKGTANVVNAALLHKVEKLCYVSSIASLGRADANAFITEETPWKDSDKSSPYSISKYNAELEVWRGIEEGLKAVIVNPSVIFGPTKWDSGSAALFSLVWKGLKFYTAGESGYVYVRDVSWAMIELMESNIASQRYTLSAENVSYRKLFSVMAQNLGKPIPTIPVKLWMSELSWRMLKIGSFFTRKQPSITKNTARSSMKISRYSNKKIKETLNFEFTSLEEMIRLTAKQFLKEQS